MHKESNKKMLNLGCGQRYSKDWVNLDFVSSDKENVKTCNLKHGILFPDNYFDLVYHSHLLEHFTKSDAKKLITDCYRVLKPGGVIRIAVPDLEQICKNYIKFLELANNGDKTAEANYDWTLIEMYDQCNRNESGGEMKNYFKNNKELINRYFIRERIGYFFDIVTNYKSSGWKLKIKSTISEKNINLIKQIIKTLINILPGESYRRIGKFRMSGEVHQCMYDKFSLARLLTNSGFSKISIKTAKDSYIEKWSNFNLDTESDGKIYKADSLYIEAIK
jgi:predicted SAM-dependent methyltransferase